MKLTDALLGEHGVIYALFDHIEQELPRIETLDAVQRATRALAAALVSHARIEDELLFPALETHLGPAGPLAVMRQEHEEIEGAIEEVASAQTQEAAADRLRYGLQVARDHFAKEEQILFHMARQSLSAQELEQLGNRWAEARRVTVG